MNGPRLYNSFSPEEREARLRRKQAKRIKEIHRLRRTRIVAVFAIVFLVLGIQIGIKLSQTNRINQQVQASRATLTKVKKEKAALKTKRDNLKDPDYVAKLIRSKFYYSKPGEKVYNMPEGK